MPADAQVVDTMYTYTQTYYTTSSSSSLSGWTKYDTKWQWGNWSGWSSWQNSSVSGNDYRQVQTRNIDATYKTQYRYGRYSNSKNICACPKCGANVDSSSSWYYDTSKWVDSPVSVDTSYDYSWPANSSHNHRDVIYQNYSSKEGIYRDHWYKYVVNGGYYYFLDSTRQVVDTPAYTQYRYRTREKNYTYIYFFISHMPVAYSC